MLVELDGSVVLFAKIYASGKGGRKVGCTGHGASEPPNPRWALKSV